MCVCITRFMASDDTETQIFFTDAEHNSFNSNILTIVESHNV